MAIVCASLPAMNHFFKNILQDSRIGSAMRSWSNKNSAGSSGSRSRSKGYDHNTSQSGTDMAFNDKKQSDNQKGIHVVQEVKLEEFLNDKNYDSHGGNDMQWTRGTNFIDQESMNPPKAMNTWLEDDTSSGDDTSVRRQNLGSGHQYSGYADTRRFY
jgi:hypothetical protein